MMTNFVSAGAGFYAELIKDPVGLRKPVGPEDTYVDTATQTQEIPDEVPGAKTAVREISWEQIMEATIPASVKEVAFTVDDKDLTPEYREKLQLDYPGVVIRISSVKTEEICRKRTRRLPESRPSSPRRPDPLEHLRDLAKYAAGPEPPEDEEFGYRYAIGKDWDTLCYPRKLEIAHACAIQHHHGKVVNGPGCSRCTEKGYQCKVYLPQLCDLSHMSFSKSCQNCRLHGIQCDFASATRARMPVPSGPATLRLDKQNVPSYASGETLYTPSPTIITNMTSNTLKPNLVSRIARFTPSESDAEITIAKTTPIPPSARHPKGLLNFADQIKYPIPDKVRPVIFAMYANLRNKGETQAYGGKHRVALKHHYYNLVTL